MKHLLHLRSPLFVGILETTEIHDMNFTSFFGWVISWPQQLRHPGHGGWTGERSNHLGWRITQRRPWTWAQCAESQDNVQSGGQQGMPRWPSRESRESRGPVVGWKQLETTNNWCLFFSRSQMLELFATAFLMSGQGKTLNNFLRSLFLHINFLKSLEASASARRMEAWILHRNDACKLGWVVRLLIDRCENDKIGVIFEDTD